MMPYGILLLKRQAISFMIAYLYSAPAAYDTPMLAAYAAIVFSHSSQVTGHVYGKFPQGLHFYIT